MLPRSGISVGKCCIGSRWQACKNRKKQWNSWPSFRANAYVSATSVFVLPYVPYVQGKIGTCHYHVSHVKFHSTFLEFII